MKIWRTWWKGLIIWLRSLVSTSSLQGYRRFKTKRDSIIWRSQRKQLFLVMRLQQFFPVNYRKLLLTKVANKFSLIPVFLIKFGFWKWMSFSQRIRKRIRVLNIQRYFYTQLLSECCKGGKLKPMYLYNSGHPRVLK